VPAVLSAPARRSGGYRPTVVCQAAACMLAKLAYDAAAAA
jgi:hypothetical protein